MKKLFKKLFGLRAELRNLREDNERLRKLWNVAVLDTMEAENKISDLKKVASISENTAREMLLHLRVHGMSSGTRRTGYGVTAFIPDDVLSYLRASSEDMRDVFAITVAKELVRRAIEGLYHINSRGKRSALIFGSLSNPGAHGSVFDEPDGMQIALNVGFENKAYDEIRWRDITKMLPREADSNL